MKRDLDTSYREMFACGQLKGLQHLHAFRMHRLRLLASFTSRLQEVSNHSGRWKGGSLQPYPQGYLEGTRYVQGHVQANHQLVRSKLMPWDRSYSSLRFRKLNSCSRHGGYQSPLVAAHYSFGDCPAKLRNLRISSIQYRRYGISSLQKSTFIRVDCVSILSRHHEYRYAQRGYGSNCLDPSGPSSFIQLEVVANDRSQGHAPNDCDTKKYAGFLHESIQSCLKGILA